MNSSEEVKKAVIEQTLRETSMANARALIENIDNNCFKKCVPKPGSSLSSSETSCHSQCMDKYIAAWNVVNAAYIRRVKEALHT